MNREELLAKYTEPIKVGTDGFVRLVDVMGDDAAIVQAARVSYGAGTKTVSDDEGLIRYLLRHQHTTPLEMCVIKFHLRIPMDIQRQHIRHRMSSTNEYSTRYSEAIDSQNTTTPEEWRLQSTNNKQGSSGLLTDAGEFYHTFKGPEGDDRHYSGKFLASTATQREQHAYSAATGQYKYLLELGIAREQARKVLPLSTYTELYWKIDLHNLFHYLKLRLDPHAQLEIRELGQAMYEIVKNWVPVASKAFEDYKLNAVTLSAQELAIVRHWFTNAETKSNQFIDPDNDGSLCTLGDFRDEERKAMFDHFGIPSVRERAEFLTKIGLL